MRIAVGVIFSVQPVVGAVFRLKVIGNFRDIYKADQSSCKLRVNPSLKTCFPVDLVPIDIEDGDMA